MNDTTRSTAVLFDMDGTLVDSEPVHHRALDDVLAAHGLRVPAGFHDEMIGSSLAELHARLVETIGLAMDRDELAAAKYGAFLARRADLKPRPEAAEALAWVRARRVPFAVVSNSDRMLLDAGLFAAGLLRPGLVSVSRNDVRFGKPHPEPYVRAAWLLGVVPARCLVVEDSAPGATAGLEAGMQVLAWPEPHRADTPFPQGVSRIDGARTLADELAARLDAPAAS